MYIVTLMTDRDNQATIIFASSSIKEAIILAKKECTDHTKIKVLCIPLGEKFALHQCKSVWSQKPNSAWYYMQNRKFR